MARVGGNKKACDKYKQSGKYFENKQLKQFRHEKRMKHFAECRESGKTYQYQKNPYEKGTREYQIEKMSRKQKNLDKRLPYVKFKSTMDKLSNQLAQEQRELKLMKEGKSVANN